jgi:hypothetical protein
MSALTELRTFLATTAERCRAMRWFGPAFNIDVARDIAGDVAREQESISRQAHSAEQSDLEAVKLLEDAARDGLQAADMPAVAKAIRLIRASAKKDHDISEVAHA